MDDEPWDELMGPTPADLKRMLRQDSAPASLETTTPLRRSPASVAPPPSAMFARLPDRWAQLEKDEEAYDASLVTNMHRSVSQPVPVHRPVPHDPPATLPETPPRPTKLFMEDEDMMINDEEDLSDNNNNNNKLPKSPEQIRQEALRMLEVVDASDRYYSVHRTVTGGYTASHRTLGKQKRVPTALAALRYTVSRTSHDKNHSDRDPILNSQGDIDDEYYNDNSNHHQYEDEGILADVASLEKRSAFARPASESTTEASSSSRNWSSRYSIDHTLLAMSGGHASNSSSRATKSSTNSSSSSSSRRLLDRMDKANELERRAARNLLRDTNTLEKTPQIFGNIGSFSFRKNNVFGKQNVVVAQPNLRSVLVDGELAGSSLPPANSRVKSWQEQLQQKRTHQRLYLAAILLAIALTVSLAVVYKRDRGPNSASAGLGSNNANALAPGSVTFYVTANGPYETQEEDKLVQDLQALSPQAKFMVHLGNIQDASVTFCAPSRYGQVADLLEQSPVPMFVLPGAMDWSNCPQSTVAWQRWNDTFRFYNKNFVSTIAVQNQADQYENFAFVTSGVLFVGVHVINDRAPDLTEVQARNQRNVDWVTAMCEQSSDDIRAVVVLGNARPGLPQNKDFFDALANYLQTKFNKPMAYVHASPAGDGTDLLDDNLDEYQLFDTIPTAFGIQVDSANGVNAPVRVIVGFGDRPFIIG